MAMQQSDHQEPFRIRTVEMHTGGEPLRIIVSGFPEVRGETILEQRRYVREHLDQYRKLLVFEPRGHFDMYCALLVKPTLPEADLSVLFMHNEGYSTMCGHAVIALGRYAIDYGIVKNPALPETRVNIQCPCGLVTAYVQYDGKKTGTVRFYSIPAYVFETDVQVYVERLGNIKVDISYGGAFYALVSAKEIGLDLESSKIKDIVNVADEITGAVKSQILLKSPENMDLAFLYGTIITDGNGTFCDKPTSNICVFADRQLDRSPCGSGVTARMALQFHKGQVELDQRREFRSGVTQAIFTAKIINEVMVQQNKGVIVEVAGKGFYTGSAEFLLEDDDAIGKGFLV